MGGLPDGLSQSQLPFGVHGCGAEPKPHEHRAADALHERVQAHGHQRAGARHQRVDAAASRPTWPGDVRFGLAAVKGVGEAAVESIIAERKANGPFKDIYDFIERVNYSLVNRKCLENLAYAGAFDSISDFARCKFFGVDAARRQRHHLHRAADALRTAVPDRDRTTPSKACSAASGHVDIQRPVLPACADWSQLEKLTQGARDGRTLPLGAPAGRL